MEIEADKFGISKFLVKEINKKITAGLISANIKLNVFWNA